MDNFIKIDPEKFILSPFKRIGKDWFLISAQRAQKVNSMTAAWGAMGVMWGKNVMFTVIRPQRYTKEFVDSCDNFSVCFFPDKYKKTLSYFGKVSGREEDKIKKSGLALNNTASVPFFEQADTVIICRKLYRQSFDPACFLDKEPEIANYPLKDYHDLYISEIQDIFVRK